MADSTNPTAVNQTTPQYNTDEVLWYDNGIWGDSGYAICNPMGKTLTSNEDIFDLHTTIGQVVFTLMHQADIVAFTRPPTRVQWLYDIHQMCVVARRRLSQLTRLPNDTNGLDVAHAQPAKRAFVVYPVPYFGERIRNADVRKYATLSMLMLSEIMQHTDNDIVGYITPQFSGLIGKYVQEILAQVAMKFFGVARADAYKPDFALKDTDFAAYDPSKVMIGTELIDERPPDQWWPTTNDLSLIRGLPIMDALKLAKRWPAGPSFYSGDPSVFPGGGSAGSDANTSGVSQSSATLDAFVSPPGQVPT